MSELEKLKKIRDELNESMSQARGLAIAGEQRRILHLKEAMKMLEEL